MDVYDDSFIGLWRLLSENQVRYIMVGGFATNFHGYQRYTGDIDIFIEDTLPNRQKIRKAFRELNMGDYESMETIQFVPGWVDFALNNGVRLDIMTSLKGVNLSFDECLQLAPVAEIDGVMIPFLHINHLIANKKSVNRSKDQIDVIELEKIKKILEEKT
ncbi:MAG: nucleotidyltransferase [Chitinophagaceae bacterium]